MQNILDSFDFQNFCFLNITRAQFIQSGMVSFAISSFVDFSLTSFLAMFETTFRTFALAFSRNVTKTITFVAAKMFRNK